MKVSSFSVSYNNSWYSFYRNKSFGIDYSLTIGIYLSWCNLLLNHSLACSIWGSSLLSWITCNKFILEQNTNEINSSFDTQHLTFFRCNVPNNIIPILSNKTVLNKTNSTLMLFIIKIINESMYFFNLQLFRMYKLSVKNFGI